MLKRWNFLKTGFYEGINLEFYVDFETVNNINDNLTRIPEQNGQNLISMIGYGHMANGEWKYRCFCVDCLAEESEERIVDDWLAHMNEARLRVDPEGVPRLIHWSYAQPVNYEEAYDSAERATSREGLAPVELVRSLG